jgi:hypothetical protein
VGAILLTPVQWVSETSYESLTTGGTAVALGFIFYLALVILLGARLITRKELDRVH